MTLVLATVVAFLFFSRAAKVAGGTSAPVQPSMKQGSGENAVVDCACVDDD